MLVYLELTGVNKNMTFRFKMSWVQKSYTCGYPTAKMDF